eukprot:TRINITY_DN25618_c0_g1_i4.p1 TRINITY_DN25618_c0_g1~~TRINITY_DN25618_c0_g1_i4.p1  ORF type:complete len:110 (-),score=9.17 TRINITY_DN25618_c0_g1_i4:235-564(-)
MEMVMLIHRKTNTGGLTPIHVTEVMIGLLCRGHICHHIVPEMEDLYHVLLTEILDLQLLLEGAEIQVLLDLVRGHLQDLVQDLQTIEGFKESGSVDDVNRVDPHRNHGS